MATMMGVMAVTSGNHAGGNGCSQCNHTGSGGYMLVVEGVNSGSHVGSGGGGGGGGVTQPILLTWLVPR